MFTMGFDAYWAIVNWIIWYSIVGGIVNVYFAKKNVQLSILKYMECVLNPCLMVTFLYIIFIQLIYYLRNIVDIHWFICLLMSIVVSMLIYLPIGLNQSERQILISNLKRSYTI